jgi:heavy metal translocating P-type ATPase
MTKSFQNKYMSEQATKMLRQIYRNALFIIPLLGFLVGFATQYAGYGIIAGWIWGGAAIPVIGVLIVQIVIALWHGEFGLDIVASLSMVGALFFGENLAAVVVALMYAGGQYLESFAEIRARREMTRLLARAPRTAARYRNRLLEEVSLDVLAPGDRIMVRRGEVVAVDGKVAKGIAVLDQAALTGEALPVQQHSGDAVMSGAINAGNAFDLVVSARAEASTYAAIVRLVEAAQQSKAPMSRLADRFAMAFLGVTVAFAGGAWIWTGDPIRGLAVLVVATPCPLILAVPVAIISGISRAAKLGILIKGGRAMENLARVRTLVIDKTGTLTYGAARLVSVEPASGFTSDEVLGLAASLDQASSHVIAQALVSVARQKGCALIAPDTVSETAGEGIEGLVGGQKVAVGGLDFVARRCSEVSRGIENVRPGILAGSVLVAVAIDGRMAGRLVLSDQLRQGTGELLHSLRAAGITRIVLASGDRAAVVNAVVAGLPIDDIRSGLTPEQKIAIIQDERQKAPVVMVGDGVNDAPALALADVGIAMGGKGAAASSEVADVVLLVDRLDRVLNALQIARRSRHIALESVYVGIGLSFIAMVVAAFGYLTPVRGALLQEVIDVAVILNALRALIAPPEGAGWSQNQKERARKTLAADARCDGILTVARTDKSVGCGTELAAKLNPDVG